MRFDTTAEATRIRLEVLRGLGGAARLKEALELSEAVRRIAEQGRDDRADTRRPETHAGAG